MSKNVNKKWIATLVFKGGTPLSCITENGSSPPHNGSIDSIVTITLGT
jgi:hypothetical protein